MTELSKRKNVDSLIDQFWRKGYLTLSRKFGTYLPEPQAVGGFEVDIIARHKNQYAIGLTINSEDLKDKSFLVEKIKYLATRQTRYTKLPVILFIGVKEEDFKETKFLVDKLDESIRKNIRMLRLSEQRGITKRQKEEKSTPLFS